MNTYHIHDNGASPFLVEIQDKTVKVYGFNNQNFEYTDQPIFTFLNNTNIFIGKSPKIK